MINKITKVTSSRKKRERTDKSLSGEFSNDCCLDYDIFVVEKINIY